MSHTKTYVYLTCTKELVNIKSVEFEDISEDASGRDLMTFLCPKCKTLHVSLVVGDR